MTYLNIKNNSMNFFKSVVLFAAVITALTLCSNAWANPSAYPESGLTFAVGYDSGSDSLEGAIGAEWLLPVSVLDMSVALELAKDSLDTPLELGVTLNTLVLPAWGMNPPLAVGFAVDMHYEHDMEHDMSVVAGPLIGTDLLFNTEFPYPITLSAFFGVGFENPTGFITSWSAYARYYFDDVDLALEITTDTERLIGVGLRYVFY